MFLRFTWESAERDWLMELVLWEERRREDQPKRESELCIGSQVFLETAKVAEGQAPRKSS